MKHQNKTIDEKPFTDYSTWSTYRCYKKYRNKTKHSKDETVQKLQEALILTYHIDLKSISLFLDFIKTNHSHIKETELLNILRAKNDKAMG